MSLAALVRAEHATTELVTRLPAGANTQFAAETCSQLLEEYEEESEETFHLIPTRCLLTGNFHGISPNSRFFAEFNIYPEMSTPHRKYF